LKVSFHQEKSAYIPQSL